MQHSQVAEKHREDSREAETKKSATEYTDAAVVPPRSRWFVFKFVHVCCSDEQNQYCRTIVSIVTHPERQNNCPKIGGNILQKATRSPKSVEM